MCEKYVHEVKKSPRYKRTTVVTITFLDKNRKPEVFTEVTEDVLKTYKNRRNGVQVEETYVSEENRLTVHDGYYGVCKVGNSYMQKSFNLSIVDTCEMVCTKEFIEDCDVVTYKEV